MDSIRWKLLAPLSLLLVFIPGCSGGGSGGGSSQTNPTPAISELNPNSAVGGSPALMMTVTGTGFVSASAVEWNGVRLSTTYVSSASLTAQIPASDLSAAGTAAVTVENPAPGGGTSNSINFTTTAPPNPTPTATSLSPSSAIVGGSAFKLTVTGTQFIPNSQVLWNGSQVPTTYVSSTSITAQIPASDLSAAGTATVSVQNPAPGGGTSGNLTFTIENPPNPAPTATSLSPASATVGGSAFALTVTGTQFVADSQVLWNGGQVPTTYISSTSLTAQIPASDLSAVGSASVSVKNPAPGGGQSGNLAFVINPVGTNMQVLGLEGTDVIWNPGASKLYVAVPESASNSPGSITEVDPIAGTPTKSLVPGSAPYAFAISDDSQYLYAVMSPGSTIQRFALPSLTPDIQWALGSDSSSGSSNLAGDIAVQPGSPHTLAVSYGEYGSGSIAVFDDSVERSVTSSNGNVDLGNALQWNADGSQLYSASTYWNDSTYYAAVSDDALFTMPVTSRGIGTVTTYHSAFRAEGARLHADVSTGYIYTDWGEVINPANGIPKGNYRSNRSDQPYFPGPLSVIDSTLKRFYTLLQIAEPDGSSAFQIQAFNQTEFQLLSTIVIPNAIGQPTNFIRWGQSGLAFTTIGSGSTSGVLYILDGSFVNPSGVLDTSLGMPVSLVPSVAAISPITATVGSGALTLTVTGTNFIGQPTVFWNGTALPTTLVNSTELTAQIPPVDLAAVGQASITVSNSGTSFPASSSLPFSVNSTPPSGSQISVYSTGGNDLAWDATSSRIYVSMPGSQGSAGDAIGIVDPVTGNITSSGFLGSDPAKLSLSANGQYLYTALNGQNEVEQLTLPSFQVSAAWNLGGVTTLEGPYYALDLQAAPGASQTTAITLANFDISPGSSAVVIYDGSTQRQTPLEVGPYPYSSLQWAGTSSTLYAADQQEPQDFLVLGVGADGATLNQSYKRILNPYSENIHYDPGTALVYTDGGQIINPANGGVAGNFGSSGIAVPASALNKVFILGQTAAQAGTSSYTIESFDQTTFKAVGSLTVDNVVGTPTALITWGMNGLAFTTRIGSLTGFLSNGPGQLYVISGNFVKPSDSGTPSTPAGLLPLKRTWGRELPKPWSSTVVVHRNPWAQP